MYESISILYEHNIRKSLVSRINVESGNLTEKPLLWGSAEPYPLTKWDPSYATPVSFIPYLSYVLKCEALYTLFNLIC